MLGHSQVFWSEIGADVTMQNRSGYPAGRVTPGRLVELMRDYPNLYGDLSAGSGFNAISRDLEFGCAFLEQFQGPVVLRHGHLPAGSFAAASGFFSQAP